jgi:predicted RNA polymerase sigma factor
MTVSSTIRCSPPRSASSKHSAAMSARRAAYRRALELAGTAPERRFLEERLAAL